MSKILKALGYFVLGLFALSIGFFGAIFINSVFDMGKELSHQEESINQLLSENDAFIEIISGTREAVYILMGDITTLKHRETKDEEKIKNLNSEVERLTGYSVKLDQKNFKLSKDVKNLEPKTKLLEKELSNVIVENIKLSEKIKQLNQNKQEKEIKPSYESLKSHTVYIRKGYFGVGTGIVVKIKGNIKYILTNKHVCNIGDRDQCFIEIYKYNNVMSIPLEFVKQDKYYDLALWKTRQSLPNKTPIKGLKEANPQDKVYSVGNYLGMRYIYTEGTFAGCYESNAKMNNVANLPCAGGCSGSAVYDKDENLVGIIYAGNIVDPFTMQADTAKSVLVPYEAIKLFLERII